jgi:hypothetical protein
MRGFGERVSGLIEGGGAGLRRELVVWCFG